MRIASARAGLATPREALVLFVRCVDGLEPPRAATIFLSIAPAVVLPASATLGLATLDLATLDLATLGLALLVLATLRLAALVRATLARALAAVFATPTFAALVFFAVSLTLAALLARAGATPRKLVRFDVSAEGFDAAVFKVEVFAVEVFEVALAAALLAAGASAAAAFLALALVEAEVRAPEDVRSAAGFAALVPVPFALRLPLEAAFWLFAVFLLEGIRGYSSSLSRFGDGTEAS